MNTLVDKAGDRRLHRIDVGMTGRFLERHGRIDHDRANPLLWRVGDDVEIITSDHQVYYGIVVSMSRAAWAATIDVVPR